MKKYAAPVMTGALAFFALSYQRAPANPASPERPSQVGRYQIAATSEEHNTTLFVVDTTNGTLYRYYKARHHGGQAWKYGKVEKLPE